MWENLDLSTLGDMFDNVKVNSDADLISTKSGFRSIATIKTNIFSYDGVENKKTKDSVKHYAKKSGNKKLPKKKNQKSKAKKKKTPNTNGRVTRSASKKWALSRGRHGNVSLFVIDNVVLIFKII